ncbi:ShlB/FhaC/HecB family hemolysin secretion/activation protein [Arcobacter aquimarinus]|uniref:Hemolysin secretion/activation protein, ShlB/FhaC/HecB family n=1 Tax=Arcobacter aquimarinus TaxID=1315211 RepID=A0AAE7B5C0_9BACT|nr:ShlB/FhaC/HecB family hemolysin secretion/activation protein [Arcobacter aquimarinus]QKE25752.1 hemolysin secretion/activation protein, ShlB/FhaC/HecB family [Arcobacter aquimarinus]RXI35187.1 hemin-binding protein [Arcobacter aquimarinus]
MKKLLTISIITVNCLLATVPDIDTIPKSIIIPKEVKKQTPSLIDIEGKEKYAPVMKDDKSGKKILVKGFDIKGNNNLSYEELNNEINSFLNKELNFNQLQEITSIITKKYREKGFFVARAYIPMQDIKQNNNIFKIVVIEGNYGKFKLINNSLVNNSTVQNMFDNAKNRGNVISTDTLERAMLVINNTPGAVVSKAEIKPGKEVGSSDFLVEVDASKRVNSFVVFDNYGNKYIGKNRIMSGVDINSPFKLGDKISLFGLISNGADLKNYKISYNFPLMANGLRAGLSYNNTDYNLVNLDDGILDEEYFGDSKIFEVSLEYPIIKSRLETLDFTAIYSDKNISSTTDEKDSKEINSISFGLNHIKNQTFLGLNAKTTLEAILTIGELADKSMMNGSYQKINFNSSIDLDITSIYSISSSIKLQKAFKNQNLDGSEDMNIGGSNGVKVFPDAELSAEQAALFNVEFFAKLPEVSGLNHKIGLFYDIGTASMSQKDEDIIFERRTLQDIGFGYYTNYKNTFTKLQVARVVGGQDIETENIGNISKVLFQTGLVF